MNNEELKEVHGNLDAMIRANAARAASEGIPASDARDSAIIFACASIARDELPRLAETDNDQLALGKKRLRTDITRMLEVVREAVDSGLERGHYYFHPWMAEQFHIASELAYEFDESLSSEIDEEREKVEEECKERSKRPRQVKESTKEPLVTHPVIYQSGNGVDKMPPKLLAWLEGELSEDIDEEDISGWSFDPSKPSKQLEIIVVMSRLKGGEADRTEAFTYDVPAPLLGKTENND